MQELEKILEEIKGLHGKVGTECTIEDRHAKRAWEHCLKRVEDIVCNHMNDGWIPVEERLPEVFGKYWVTIRYDDGRISEPVVVNFQGVKQKYVVDTPNGREYETWGIDSAFHGSRVIAWREYYIPEAYRPERSDNHDGE